MNSTEIKKRLDAAFALLTAPTIGKSSFESVRTLIAGINPKIDRYLSVCSKHLSAVERMQKGEVIEFSLENIPEDTPERKKRKKALLLFLTSWKQLKSEVLRVQKELSQISSSGHSMKSKVSTLSKILYFSKGPLAVITVIAVGIVILQSLAVNVTVRNMGCAPINLTFLPFQIPGLKFPKTPIVDGGVGIVTVPPLPITIDGILAPRIKLKVAGLSYGFDLSGIEIQYNGNSIEGTTTSLNLGDHKSHEFIVKCR